MFVCEGVGVMPRVAQEPVMMSSQGEREPDEKVGFETRFAQWGVFVGRASVSEEVETRSVVRSFGRNFMVEYLLSLEDGRSG